MAGENREPNGLARALRTVLERELAGPVRIEGLRRLTGGASRETWSFDAVDGRGACHPLVLRKDFPPEARPSLGQFVDEADLDREGEFRLLRVLFEADVPVPRPVCSPPRGVGLDDSFVMERVEGESLPKRILRDEALAGARRSLTAQVASALARIHAVDRDGLPALPERSVERQIELCRKLLDFGPEPRPVLELALAWLRENVPPLPGDLRLVHGDFRNGNFVVGPDGLRAVLDWEYAHVADPREDLGFLCMRPWRFGNTDREVGGFGTREELYEAYEQAGGEPVDPEAVRYWEILGNLKWGALCVVRGMTHVRGLHRSVEAAAIGRRVAETEYDILSLLEGRGGESR